MKITINGVEITLEFSFKSWRVLSEMWGLPSVQAAITALDEKTEAAAIDCFAEVIYSVVKVSKVAGSEAITVDDCGDWVYKNTRKFPEIKAIMLADFNVPEKEGKPIAAKVPAANP